MSRSITIKDIARHFNISITTVSKALNGKPGISRETCEKIIDYANQMNYEKNLNAVALKKGKLKTFGVVLPDISESFYSLAVSGIGDQAKAEGYNVAIMESKNDPITEIENIRQLKSGNIAGLIICLTKLSGYSLDYLQQIQEQGFPVVFFDRVPTDKNFYTVSCDLYNASQEIVDYLWAKGHHHIGIIRGPQSLYTSLERMKGFMEGLKKKKHKTDGSLFSTTDLSYEGTRKAMKDILFQKVKPTAVVTFNDYVALDALKYIREETDLIVNKDIVTVSYGNLIFTKYIEKNKPIASIEQYPEQQGIEAVKLLMSLIKEEPLTNRKTLIKGSLIKHFE